MLIEPTALDGVMILTPQRHGDARGFFSETWNRKRLQEAGIDIDFVQDNHSLSERANTLRGLHFQTPPHAQTKLVRCGKGRLFDVAVDIRQGLPTYGQHGSRRVELRERLQLLVPGRLRCMASSPASPRPRSSTNARTTMRPNVTGHAVGTHAGSTGA